MAVAASSPIHVSQVELCSANSGASPRCCVRNAKGAPSMETTRCLLNKAQVAQHAWGELAATTVFLINHAPLKAIGLTPYNCTSCSACKGSSGVSAETASALAGASPAACPAVRKVARKGVNRKSSSVAVANVSLSRKQVLGGVLFTSSLVPNEHISPSTKLDIVTPTKNKQHTRLLHSNTPRLCVSWLQCATRSNTNKRVPTSRISTIAVPRPRTAQQADRYPKAPSEPTSASRHIALLLLLLSNCERFRVSSVHRANKIGTSFKMAAAGFLRFLRPRLYDRRPRPPKRKRLFVRPIGFLRGSLLGIKISPTRLRVHSRIRTCCTGRRVAVSRESKRTRNDDGFTGIERLRSTSSTRR